jgi:hypothetical protein
VDVETYVVDFLVSGAARGTPQRWRAGDRSLVVMSFAVCGFGIAFTLGGNLGIR